MCGYLPCCMPFCTWSEEHRAACEAREVMRWPAEKRREYYARVMACRGAEALADLVESVKREWKNRVDASLSPIP